MAYNFNPADNARYRYRHGDLFLGVDPAGAFEVGVSTERHAITIAGAGSGKGAACIIPNLLRWPHNALVIDPKGEAAEATYAAREKLGQAVHVLDPFGVADVPDRIKAKLNVLDEIDPQSQYAREDINVLTDGLVMRHDPRAGHWDDGAKVVLAGLIGFVCAHAPSDYRTLTQVRSLLTQPQENFGQMIASMERSQEFGGLPAAAAAKLNRSGSEAPHFLSGGQSNTEWLDSPSMVQALSGSTFKLSDLKTKPCTVFLVLPAHLLGEHGRFLRLFVRMALNAMAKGGTKGGQRCLFLLDEFFSLGSIDEIAKAAGLMRGYGVQLWPILQDLGQLVQLYGREGAQTFFGNADAHLFFGNTDGETLDYISQRIGHVRPDEVPLPPAPPVAPVAAPPPSPRDPNARPSFIGSAFQGFSAINERGLQEAYQRASAKYQEDMTAYQQEMATVGKPRIDASEVREMVVKGNDDKVARSMLVFAKGADVLRVKLAPYFQKHIVGSSQGTAAPDPKMSDALKRSILKKNTK